MNKSLSVHISGRVQGVGYRYFVVQLARNLNLTGYVRNLSDGRVEVAAEGEEDKLKQFIVALKAGPSGAVVEVVKVEWKEYSGKCREFNITY